MATTRTTQVHQDGELVSERVDEIGPVDANLSVIEYRIRRSLAENATFLELGSPSAAEVREHVRSLTRQVNALIRMSLSAFDSSDDT